MEFPTLRDWLGDLDKRIRGKGQSKEDLVEIIHSCEELMQELAPVHKFIQGHRTSIAQWMAQYQQLYITRFGEQPPTRPAEAVPEHLRLDTAAKRKKAVRDFSVRLAEPGNEVTDKEVLEIIEQEGMRFVASNPTATISTILYGFSSEFEKLEGKRGAFKRKDSPVTDTG